MVEIRNTRRPLVLLAIVVFAQVLLLAFQVRRTARSERGEVPLIRYWTVQIIMPFERAGTWTASHIGGLWSGYIGLRDARAENLRLRSENDRLKLRNRELESDAAEVESLKALLDFRQEHPEAPMVAAQVIGSSSAMVAAQVISASADLSSHTLFINRGERDRIRRNMAVITPDGIVGKIVEVFPTTSQVLLINDRDSGVGAMFVSTRTHGVIKGGGDGAPRMEYVENDEKVHNGDAIVTSGEDRIFPKGLPIGIVADAKQANPFQIIHVRTAARLDRLEDILVLLTQQELNLEKGERAAAASASSPSRTPSPASSAKPGTPRS
ncbi:MAG TPA: rod shape-determining protein MreC [Candidatus Cybelea sp.]|nr:rod shape-determining protein MreC [Candidatus Cybelea sp.]